MSRSNTWPIRSLGWYPLAGAGHYINFKINTEYVAELAREPCKITGSRGLERRVRKTAFFFVYFAASVGNLKVIISFTPSPYR
jgi:hypothetical protein